MARQNVLNDINLAQLQLITKQIAKDYKAITRKTLLNRNQLY